jgi:hypothetical protein
MPFHAGVKTKPMITPSRRPTKAEAYASAFTRLANQNLSDIDPEPWVVFLFYNHPP